MPETLRYRRVLLKISGESLCSPGSRGMDAGAIAATADALAGLAGAGVQLAVVVGGGNILRGRELRDNPSIDRTTADYMGMLATVINALALREALAARGVKAVATSAIPMPTLCEPYTIRMARQCLDGGQVVILAGGTGSPFFTTDTCAALRAAEINADVLMKATKVDGVYDADPADNPKARRHKHLTYQRTLNDELGVMDLTAVSLCMTGDIPILVFRLDGADSLLAAATGQEVGTLIDNQ